MDEQERKTAFRQAYDELVGRFGMAFSVNAHASKHGSSWLIEQVIDIVPVSGWRAPESVIPPAAEKSPNGKPILIDGEAQQALHPGNDK